MFNSIEKKIKKLEAQGYDMNLIEKVQPQGNMLFKSDYIQAGDGYYTILEVYGWPQNGLAAFWGVYLVGNPKTITQFSISSENQQEMLRTLSSSMGEKQQNVWDAQKPEEVIKAQTELEDVQNEYAKLTRNNGVIKRVYIRIFVEGDTLDELKQNVNEIGQSATDFKIKAFGNELQYEYKTNFMPPARQSELPNARKGTLIPTDVLGGMYFLNHTFLSDPHGSFFGLTSTNGAVMFDFFHRDNNRTRSFAFVSGSPGMGKSTLLKKKLFAAFSVGSLIRNFDVAGEYIALTKELGGTIIDLASPKNAINPFEIFASSIDDETGEVDQIASFAAHKEKLKSIANFINTDLSQDDLILLDKQITEFYENRGLWKKNPVENLKGKKIVGLGHDKYPLLHDFVNYLKSSERKASSNNAKNDFEIKGLYSLHAIFDQMLQSNATIFDVPTTIKDLSEIPFITFDLGTLKQHGGGIFNAQIFSVLMMQSAEIINNGRRQRKLFSEGKITRDEIRYHYLNIDEAQNLINPKFGFGVAFITSLMEQMRKNYAAVVLAAPTIKDIVPDSVATSDQMSEYRSNVTKMFDLLQYRFFFQMPDSDVTAGQGQQSRLGSVLGGSITEQELQQLPKLNMGEVLLNINGDKNLTFEVSVTEQELALFGGG